MKNLESFIGKSIVWEYYADRTLYRNIGGGKLLSVTKEVATFKSSRSGIIYGIPRDKLYAMAELDEEKYKKAIFKIDNLEIQMKKNKILYINEDIMKKRIEEYKKHNHNMGIINTIYFGIWIVSLLALLVFVLRIGIFLSPIQSGGTILLMIIVYISYFVIDFPLSLIHSRLRADYMALLELGTTYRW